MENRVWTLSNNELNQKIQEHESRDNLKTLYIITMRNGTIYSNKAYTNKDRAVRVFDAMCDSSIYDDNEACLHVLWLPFIGRTVSYIYESEFIVPGNATSIDVLNAHNYYRRKIFACEEHAKKSEILKAIYDEAGTVGVSIQHIRVVKN